MGIIERRRFGEEIDAVSRVETAGEAARHLHILLLVLADGDFHGLVDDDVGSHQGRISQEAGADAVLVALVEDFAFHVAFGRMHTVNVELLAGFILERSGAHQLADAGIHI